MIFQISRALLCEIVFINLWKTHHAGWWMKLVLQSMDELDSIRQDLDDECYADCLIFRKKLYDLKPALHTLVRRTFKIFQSELKSEHANVANVSDICRRKGPRVKKNYSFNGWRRVDGWPILARSFNEYFPADGNLENVDVSTLITLICCCELFSRYSALQTAAVHVRKLRNDLYGHIPELRITGGLRTCIKKLNALTKIVAKHL